MTIAPCMDSSKPTSWIPTSITTLSVNDLMHYQELEKLLPLWRGNTVNMACIPASM